MLVLPTEEKVDLPPFLYKLCKKPCPLKYQIQSNQIYYTMHSSIDSQ